MKIKEIVIFLLLIIFSQVIVDYLHDKYHSNEDCEQMHHTHDLEDIKEIQ